MSDKKVLIEKLTPNQANIIQESHNDGQDLYLNGIFMQADLKNGNGRNYPLSEITKAVEYIQGQIDEGVLIAGELNHPDHLQIDLERVSHVITEIRMDGNNAVGKAKLLNTPMGNLAKGLLEGGMRLGVSSRGTGDVNEGIVSDFDFLTIDIVATPSAPEAFPEALREGIESLPDVPTEVKTLTESVRDDDKSQKSMVDSMLSFIADLVD